MHGQIGCEMHESDVIPLERAAKCTAPGEADQLDKAGQTILQLVQRAAGIAEENSRHALDTAQRLSHQLRAAEDRIGELEAELTAYQERADRAEQWLHRVYAEIEDRFLHQSDSRHAMNGAPQRSPNARRRAN
jgi:DNA repair exonuclease SbcCD ATPase subunit